MEQVTGMKKLLMSEEEKQKIVVNHMVAVDNDMTTSSTIETLKNLVLESIGMNQDIFNTMVIKTKKAGYDRLHNDISQTIEALTTNRINETEASKLIAIENDLAISIKIQAEYTQAITVLQRLINGETIEDLRKEMMEQQQQNVDNVRQLNVAPVENVVEEDTTQLEIVEVQE